MLLVLTALTLITLDARAGKGAAFGSVRSAADGVIGPVERAAGAVVSPIGSFFSGLGGLGRYKGKASTLEKENGELRKQLQSSVRARAKAAELDSLLGLAGRGGYRILPAQVSALGGTFGFEWTATINVGSSDGVQADMTVLNGDGLVGRVVRVGPYTSTVLLAIDSTSGVGVRIEQSSEVGTVQGRGEGQPLEFTALSSNLVLKPGQRLVTLGSPDSSYAPELPVGRITKVETTPGGLQARALVAPYVGFTSLDAVGVVVGLPERPAHDSVLPPKPTTAPPASASPGPGGSPGASPSGSSSPSASPS